MSFSKLVGELECQKVLEECWKISLNVEDAFPEEISKWIKYQSVLSGVPTTYIAWPVIVCSGYCSQHAWVQIEAPPRASAGPLPTRTKKVIIHEEPLVIYALVVGRSGKKSLLFKNFVPQFRSRG